MESPGLQDGRYEAQVGVWTTAFLAVTLVTFALGHSFYTTKLPGSVFKWKQDDENVFSA